MLLMILKMSAVTALYVLLTALIWLRTRGQKLTLARKLAIGLVYGACAADVRLVMTGGVLRVKDGALTGFDLSVLRNELEKALPAFRRAAEKYAAII